MPASLWPSHRNYEPLFCADLGVNVFGRGVEIDAASARLCSLRCHCDARAKLVFLREILERRLAGIHCHL